MAYMNQEKKKVINTLVKEVMPENWKYSLTVERDEAIKLAIMKADVDLIALNKHLKNQNIENITTIPVNHHFLDEAYDGEVLEILTKISNALNHNNYNNSCIQSDYVDVGHYVRMQVGKWNKPFEVIVPKPKQSTKRKGLGM